MIPTRKPRWLRNPWLYGPLVALAVVSVPMLPTGWIRGAVSNTPLIR